MALSGDLLYEIRVDCFLAAHALKMGLHLYEVV